MHRILGTVLAAATMLSATHALAAQEAPAVTQREVAQLLDFVGTSDCQFNRNGSWYDAARARAHLQEKYDYLNRRGQIPTAEAFIDTAASQSSISGKAYQVRCGGGPAMPSAVWLSRELQRLRAGGH